MVMIRLGPLSASGGGLGLSEGRLPSKFYIWRPVYGLVGDLMGGSPYS